MTRILQLMALIAALALPALCQYGRLSPDDQREFDKAYARWVNDSRKDDRNDVDRDVRRMQDMMARNNIPPDVPYEQIATSGYNGRPRGEYNDKYRGYEQSRLSPDDQHEFDKAYEKWEKDVRKHDRDDIRKDERRMQDIMARYNIPRQVPYDQVASPEYRH